MTSIENVQDFVARGQAAQRAVDKLTTNGANTLKTPVPEAPLPADRQKTVEAGLAMFQQVQAERDDLRKLLQRAEERIVQQRVEIESLGQLHSMLESHIQSYMLQRDQAIADRAVFETLFASIFALLRAFRIPAAPLVKEASEQDVAAS